MARKSKRRPARTRPRPAAPPAGTGSPVAQQAARTGGDQSLVRAVEMSLAPRTAATARRGQRGILIGDDDPGIPLDRVPYFVADLKKLGIVAGVMVALLVVGSQMIPLVAG